MYLTLIFRADHFSDGTIQQCLENGVLDKLMKRVEAIILEIGFQRYRQTHPLFTHSIAYTDFAE